MTLTLRLLGLFGFVIFALALSLTFLSPMHYEKAARGFLESKISEQVRARIDIVPNDVQEGRIASFARSLAERHENEIAELRQRLASSLNQQVAEAVARMQDVNCECRQRLAIALDAATTLRISSLESAEPQLRRLIEGRYGEIVSGLLRDMRIFTGSSAVAFALLLGISFAQPDRIRQLFVPGVLLAVATLVASGIYIFGQNWFFTLLYSDYVGYGYIVWLLLIYGFLCDIALFQARLTTRIVDAVTYVVTSPC